MYTCIHTILQTLLVVVYILTYMLILISYPSYVVTAIHWLVCN